MWSILLGEMFFVYLWNLFEVILLCSEFLSTQTLVLYTLLGRVVLSEFRLLHFLRLFFDEQPEFQCWKYAADANGQSDPACNKGAGHDAAEHLDEADSK